MNGGSHIPDTQKPKMYYSLKLAVISIRSRCCYACCRHIAFVGVHSSFCRRYRGYYQLEIAHRIFYTLRYIHLKSTRAIVSTPVIAHTQYFCNSDWKVWATGYVAIHLDNVPGVICRIQIWPMDNSSIIRRGKRMNIFRTIYNWRHWICKV